MTKIIIPLIAYETIPAIYKLVDDLTNLNSQVLKYVEGDNLIIDYSGVVRAENKFTGDESVILSILDNGGTIENYLFGIEVPLGTIDEKIPVGVPGQIGMFIPEKTFKDWFANNASVWKNTVTGKAIFYNQPEPSNAIILTGAESDLIRKIDIANSSFHTVAEVLIKVAKSNWVKL